MKQIICISVVFLVFTVFSVRPMKLISSVFSVKKNKRYEKKLEEVLDVEMKEKNPIKLKCCGKFLCRNIFTFNRDVFEKKEFAPERLKKLTDTLCDFYLDNKKFEPTEKKNWRLVSVPYLKKTISDLREWEGNNGPVEGSGMFWNIINVVWTHYIFDSRYYWKLICDKTKSNISAKMTCTVCLLENNGSGTVVGFNKGDGVEKLVKEWLKLEKDFKELLKLLGKQKLLIKIQKDQLEARKAYKKRLEANNDEEPQKNICIIL